MASLIAGAKLSSAEATSATAAAAASSATNSLVAGALKRRAERSPMVSPDKTSATARADDADDEDDEVPDDELPALGEWYGSDSDDEPDEKNDDGEDNKLDAEDDGAQPPPAAPAAAPAGAEPSVADDGHDGMRAEGERTKLGNSNAVGSHKARWEARRDEPAIHADIVNGCHKSCGCVFAHGLVNLEKIKVRSLARARALAASRARDAPTRAPRPERAARISPLSLA